VGEQLDRHGLGQPGGGRAAPRRRLLAPRLRLEELANGCQPATTPVVAATSCPAGPHCYV
jgi:hypothetical protein